MIQPALTPEEWKQFTIQFLERNAIQLCLPRAEYIGTPGLQYMMAAACLSMCPERFTWEMVDELLLGLDSPSVFDHPSELTVRVAELIAALLPPREPAKTQEPANSVSVSWSPSPQQPSAVRLYRVISSIQLKVPGDGKCGCTQWQDSPGGGWFLQLCAEHGRDWAVMASIIGTGPVRPYPNEER